MIKSKNIKKSVSIFFLTECPYAWVEIRGRCYRFNPVQTAKGAARKFCSQYDAYPVVLETEQETEELMNTVANISK